MTAPEALFSESTLKAADGINLHVKRWHPAAGEPRGHVLIIHGYMEHSGRYRDVAHALCAAGLGVAAMDVRGHGKTDGQRGRVDRFSDSLDDAAIVLETLPSGPRFILGHSHGDLIALDFVATHKPAIKGLAPMQRQNSAHACGRVSRSAQRSGARGVALHRGGVDRQALLTSITLRTCDLYVGPGAAHGGG